MKILRNYSLLHLNTLGVDCKTAYYTRVHSLEEAQSLLLMTEYRHVPKLILGGGSNILLTGDFPGLVIHNVIKGINIVKEDHDHAIVEAGAGEVWHDLVMFSIANGLGGLENLSLIPGCVGASPIQNIGAYGVEMKDTFYSLEAVDLPDAGVKTFTRDECRFAYRDSIFKNEARNRYLIASVSFRLSKNPVLNTSYGAIDQELTAMGITKPDIRDVSRAVINIRRSKLPDPAEFGNAGSFFKNPEIDESLYEELQKKFPGIVAYKTVNNKMKLAAGWLIEQCGWKGKIEGRVGMHHKQALVLVNYGGANGKELLAHARRVQESVNEKFGVLMEMEVNLI